MYFQPRIEAQTMIKCLKIVNSSTVKVLCSTSFHDFSQNHIERNLHERSLQNLFELLSDLISKKMTIHSGVRYGILKIMFWNKYNFSHIANNFSTDF